MPAIRMSTLVSRKKKPSTKKIGRATTTHTIGVTVRFTFGTVLSMRRLMTSNCPMLTVQQAMMDAIESRLRFRLEAQRQSCGHRRQYQAGADDEGGGKGKIHPSERPRQAVLRFRQRQHGQAGHAENEGDDVDRGTTIGKEQSGTSADQGNDSGGADGEQPGRQRHAAGGSVVVRQRYWGMKRTRDDGKPMQDRVPAITAMTQTHTKMPNSSGPIQRAISTWLT